MKIFIALLFSLFAITAQAVPVNINTADAATIASSLKGIGVVKATAIVEYRNENGPFEDPYHVTRVRGIADRLYEKLKDEILVTD